jgi:hypothetical protein
MQTSTEQKSSSTAAPWPSLSYNEWSDTCDTLHAHTQVLGKLAAHLAPPEPQLQHAALRLTARGWETAPLPAPDRSGSFVVTLDLHGHQTLVEHSDGRAERIALTPNRPVGDVTREVLAGVRRLAGAFRIDLRPAEVPWSVALDEDDEHHSYDVDRVATYFAMATRAALVLSELRAPYRGRSTPVNAWWGTFDLAVSLFSGRSAEPPSNEFIARNAANAEQIEVGWWPGDGRHNGAAFFGYAFPSPEDFARATLSSDAAHFDETLGEYVLEWDDVITSDDPHASAVHFGRSLISHSCALCAWDPELAKSAQGIPPAIS